MSNAGLKHLSFLVIDHPFASLVTLVITYFLWKAFYNYFFHPLAHYPGPFLAKFTDLYLAYVIGSVPTFGLSLHQKHGALVRLAPDLLSFSDPKLLPKVYHRNADKPQFYGSWMFGSTAAMFQSLLHQDHAAKKRLVAPCCSMKAMRGFEPKISNRVDELCEKIRERSVLTGKAVDFSEHLRWFLSDVWNELVYGEPNGCVREGKDVRDLLDALQGIYPFSATAAVMPWLMPSLRIPMLRKYFWSFTKTFKCMDIIFNNFEDKISQRRTDPKLQQTELFFDRLNSEGIPRGPTMPHEDLKAEVITFSAATLDGVAAFICPFIDNLVQNPNVLARLLPEIDSADTAGKLSKPVVTYDETTRLKYFMACISETLRRDAPAQTILPRIVSKGGYEIYGRYIPEGTRMGASPYIIHRDSNIFGPEPDEFKPERWLEGDGVEQFVAQMEKYGMWWGYGDRECAGKYYAQMEMQKLCLELVRRFKFESPVDGGERFVHKRWAVGMFWNYRLVFRDRKRGVL